MISTELTSRHDLASNNLTGIGCIAIERPKRNGVKNGNVK
jgi:hypothetical protein